MCQPGRAHYAPVAGSTQGLTHECGCVLRVSRPCLERMWPLHVGSSAGVNEAFSAPGGTQGLRAAALIRLLSPRQWLLGAGQGVRAVGPDSTALTRAASSA